MDPSFDSMAAAPVTRDAFFAAAEVGDMTTVYRFFMQAETLAAALRVEATIEGDLIDYAGKELHRDNQSVVPLTSWVYRKDRYDYVFRVAIMNRQCDVVEWLYTWPLAPFLCRTLQFFLLDAAINAVVFKEDHLFELLLESHAWAMYPNEAKPVFLSALIRAGIDRKSSSVLRILSAHGADFNRPFDHGFGTPLYHTAFYDPQTIMTGDLVQHGMFTVGPDLALHLAARDGSHDVIRRLLAFGIDPHSRDHALNTPLHYAAKEGFFESVTTLLECACVDVDAKNETEDTPLILAITRSWSRDEEDEQSEDPDEDVQRRRDSISYRRVFNILLDFGADPNMLYPAAKTYMRRFIMPFAVSAWKPYVSYLRAVSTPTRGRPSDGGHQRTCFPVSNLLKLLVQHGADLSCEDEHGVTALSELQERNWWHELPENERSLLLRQFQ